MPSASILLVDDDEPFRRAIGRTLRGLGYRVTEAADGAQALRALRGDRPDLLITDIIMPGGDGVELIIAVRRRYPEVRILAISGRGHLAGLDLLKLAAMLGAEGALAKPFSCDELCVQLAQLAGPPRLCMA